MATASTSGDPAAAGGEPTPSSSASAQPRQPTSRVSHIVHTYLDLSSNPKKRRAAPNPRATPSPPETGRTTAAVTPSSSAQSTRFLRELGVRVSRYTHEERRDILLRYMQKRSGRRASSSRPPRPHRGRFSRSGGGGGGGGVLEDSFLARRASRLQINQKKSQRCHQKSLQTLEECP